MRILNLQNLRRVGQIFYESHKNSGATIQLLIHPDPGDHDDAAINLHPLAGTGGEDDKRFFDTQADAADAADLITRIIAQVTEKAFYLIVHDDHLVEYAREDIARRQSQEVIRPA